MYRLEVFKSLLNAAIEDFSSRKTEAFVLKRFLMSEILVAYDALAEFESNLFMPMTIRFRLAFKSTAPDAFGVLNTGTSKKMQMAKSFFTLKAYSTRVGNWRF
jgi:hypothetical protein